VTRCSAGNLEPSPQQFPDATDFVDRVVAEIASCNAGAFSLDYVRLNLDAFV
jgi:hypothetical protein